MLWAIQFEWPSDMQFTLNCYRHWANMAVRNVDGSGHFLHSKEGVNQGDHIFMIAYGIGIPPLIREIRAVHTKSHNHGTQMTLSQERNSKLFISTCGTCW